MRTQVSEAVRAAKTRVEQDIHHPRTQPAARGVLRPDRRFRWRDIRHARC
jgi:hypothetical protein